MAARESGLRVGKIQHLFVGHVLNAFARVKTRVSCENRTRLTWVEARHLCRSVNDTCEKLELVQNCVRDGIRKSVQRESNPHFRHGKAIGYRYIMDAEVSGSETARHLRGSMR